MLRKQQKSTSFREEPPREESSHFLEVSSNAAVEPSRNDSLQLILPAEASPSQPNITPSRTSSTPLNRITSSGNRELLRILTRTLNGTPIDRRESTDQAATTAASTPNEPSEVSETQHSSPSSSTSGNASGNTVVQERLSLRLEADGPDDEASMHIVYAEAEGGGSPKPMLGQMEQSSYVAEEDGEIFMDATSHLTNLPEMGVTFEEQDEHPDVTVHHALLVMPQIIDGFKQETSAMPAAEDDFPLRDWVADLNGATTAQVL